MEHRFSAIMGTLNVIRKINLNQSTIIDFLKFVYVFIKAVTGWNFDILNVLCKMTFPFSILSDMDQ